MATRYDLRGLKPTHSRGRNARVGRASAGSARADEAVAFTYNGTQRSWRETMSTCETVCSCCMERPIWPEAHAHGYEYCEECSMCEECSECWSGISEPHLIWESALCSRCERSEKLSEWLDETIEEIRRTAESHGWRLVGDDASEVSEAHYLVFERGDEERGDE